MPPRTTIGIGIRNSSGDKLFSGIVLETKHGFPGAALLPGRFLRAVAVSVKMGHLRPPQSQRRNHELEPSL